jgi:multidrug efflux system outer membrane protein
LRAQAPTLGDVFRDSILSALVRTAVERNYDVRLARARVDEARAVAGIARAQRLPLVMLNAGVGTNRTVLGAAALAYEAWGGTAGVSWDLDVWGRTRGGVDATTRDRDAEEARVRAMTVALVGEVAANYLQLLELDEETDIAERTYASRRAMLAIARARYDRGVVSELDVQQFAAQVAIPSARLAQLARARAEREHALNVLLGESPTRRHTRGSLASLAPDCVIPDSLPAAFVDARWDVVQAQRSYDAAVARAGASSAAKMPAISLTALGGTQAATPGTVFRSETQVYQLQVGLSVPLFTGGRASNELSAAQARVQEARIVYERAKLLAAREAADAMTAMKASREEVRANELLRNALRRALELSELRYQNGIANLLEVLDAQRALFDAELTLTQSRFRELTSMVQLYEALGGNWAST